MCSADSIACELNVGSASAGRIAAWSTTVTCGCEASSHSGHLAGGDQVDPAYPRCEEVDAPQRVAQLVARDEPRLPARLAGGGGPGQPGQPVEAGLVPGRVAAVHPGEDHVDREGALVHRRRGHQRQRRHADAVDLGGDGGDAAGEPLGVAVAPGRDQLPVHALLPELHLDGASLAQHGGVISRLRPRLERDRRGAPTEQVDGQLGHRAAALVPAVGGRVAQREVRRRRGRRRAPGGTAAVPPSAAPPQGRSEPCGGTTT